MTVYKTKWYLVRSDRTAQPWEFYVLTKPFGSKKAAKQHAHTHQLDEYHAWRGIDIQQRVEEQREGQAVKVTWECPDRT